MGLCKKINVLPGLTSIFITCLTENAFAESLLKSENISYYLAPAVFLLFFFVLILLYKIQSLKKKNQSESTIKKNLEKQIKDLEVEKHFFEEMFNMLPLACMISDMDGKILLPNRHFCTTMGKTEDDIIGYNMSELGIYSVPGQRERVRSELLKKGFIHNQEGTVYLSDGSKKHSLFSSQITQFQGEPAQISAYIDITELKEAEAEIKRSNERLYHAMDAENDSIWEIYPETKEAYASPNFFTMLGYEKNQLKFNEATWQNIAHPEDHSKVYGFLCSIIENKKQSFETEYRMRKKDGSWCWVLLKGRKIISEDESAPLRIAGTQINITKMKETREKLKESRENIKVTLDSIGDAVITTDISGNITGMNPVAEKLTEWKEKDALDHHLSTVFRVSEKESNEILVSPVEKVLQTGSNVEPDKKTVLLSKNSIRYNISNSASPIRKENGEIVGVVLVFRDITEEYEMEEKLRQSHKMEAIGTLAGGIAHDFNNILTGIMGYSLLALEKAEESEELVDYLKNIIRGSERAADLTEQILSFSRKTDYKKHPVIIINETREALKLIRSSIPSTIDIISSFETAKPILANPVKIHQIVMNLCTNAYHAMEKNGGTLSVVLSETELKENSLIRGKTAPSGSYIKMEISDTGVGMDKETLRRVFDPYYTTKEKGEGTGLGLALVQNIVDEHKAYMNVESAKGKGTTFTLLFPVHSETPKENSDFEIISPECDGSETVMIVDDEESIRDFCKAVLEDHGYKVKVFDNAISALDDLKNGETRYNIIVTDRTMPKMTGDIFAHEVKKIYPDMPIILISGIAEIKGFDNLEDTQIKMVIKKPFNNNFLISSIREVLDKPK